MNAVESIVEVERRKGWSVTLVSCLKGGWTCMLDCGVDILDGTKPRPQAGGETQIVALTAAIRDRDQRYPAKAKVA